MQKKHYPEIDSLKGWAIFLVILGHSIILFPINLHVIPWCGTVFALTNCIDMPLFFLVSGMCYSYKTNYKSYIGNKSKRLLVPYIVFAILETIVIQVASNYVNGSSNLLNEIKEIVFYGGGYWFLYTLYIMFLIFPLLDKIINKNKTVQMICFAVFLVLYIAKPRIDLLQIGSVLKFMFWFNLGVYLRRKYPMESLLRTEKSKWNVYLKITVALALYIGIFCVFKTRTDLTLSIKDFFVTSSGIIGSFMLIRTEWFNKIFARFGKCSLQLYLINCFTLGASRTFICNVLGVQSAAVIIAFNMLVDYFIAYLFIKYVCEKIKPVRFAMGMIY